MTIEQVLGLYNYWVVIFLMMTGFYIVIARENLIKTIIGLNIFQTSVFLLYITMGKVTNGTAPILKGDAHGHENHGSPGHGETENGHHAAEHANHVVPADGAQGGVPSVESAGLEATANHLDAALVSHSAPHPDVDTAQAVSEQLYTNPLPSVLMLTAIVVGIATTALALALIVRIREEYGTIEEDEILELDRKS